MKKKFVGGILLLVFALILAFLALVFPDNGMFTALWNVGVLTFRGDPSLLVVYLVSALFLILGVGFLVSYAKRKGDV